jgi:predicted RNA-binding Zn ribbon-like protein
MSQANFAPYLECSINLAVDLVNSFNLVDGVDGLTDPAALVEFLQSHQMTRVSKATRKDLEEVRELRTRLRGVFDARHAKEAVAILNALLEESGARPELTDHDGKAWHLHYTPHGTPLAPMVAADAAMALSVVIAEDGFERLQVCDSETCEDVFVDESKNRSRRYCSPTVCGNRAAVAAYRARRKAESARA